MVLRYSFNLYPYVCYPCGHFKFNSIITLILVEILLIGLIVDTRYTLTKDNLYIKCFIFSRLSIPLEKIISVKSSRNPISSAALSLDRLEIKFNRSNGRPDIVLISPKNKEAFIYELINRCPTIQLLK